MWSTGGSGGPNPPIGSFELCAKCKQQFTVVSSLCSPFSVSTNRVLQTKYTMAANPPPGYLCHQCAKASGVDPFKKASTPRKRKPAAEKREVVNFEQRRLPTLAALCIEVSIVDANLHSLTARYTRCNSLLLNILVTWKRLVILDWSIWMK